MRPNYNMLIFELLVVSLLAELFGNPEQLSFGLTHVVRVSSSRRTSNRTSLSGWYKMISLLESIDMIEIKNYGSANIVKGESRARRKSKILFKAMPSRILYYVNIVKGERKAYQVCLNMLFRAASCSAGFIYLWCSLRSAGFKIPQDNVLAICNRYLNCESREPHWFMEI